MAVIRQCAHPILALLTSEAGASSPLSPRGERVEEEGALHDPEDSGKRSSDPSQSVGEDQVDVDRPSPLPSPTRGGGAGPPVVVPSPRPLPRGEGRNGRNPLGHPTTAWGVLAVLAAIEVIERRAAESLDLVVNR